ncbi:prephenate dehydrogenase [Stieleria maiorica]|uniref:Prephenate dehydrogenase n=1 Tax=Stieleria maiorica TaxID=2795974 RepID=A0A5B9MAA2_9BACT|nr:prephenate dehydrogenase/arogenate dehydrogenase family protein [Stieleria maiorica]QEF96157.1 prephenate dehydrogenase [Stieleria maiorica]
MQTLPEKPAWLNRVSILGVGLLGGSVGMSLRRSGVHVVGYSRRESSCRAAVQAGAVDEGFTDIARASEGSDVVVIASPVDKIVGLAIEADAVLAETALITDVGSTKAEIVAEITARSPSAAAKFVAAHPIAGSEKTGVENASATLLDDKLVVLTPSETTAPESLDRSKSFWLQTGGRVVSMSPTEHDQRLAAVSHVPHLVSSILASLLDEECMPLVGSGWKDMTRVASGDPAMWTAICEQNREAILDQLDLFWETLASLRSMLFMGDTAALRRWLEDAKARKDATQ